MTEPVPPVVRSGLPYPLVNCSNHTPAPGYCVCKHVALEGKPVDEVELATAVDLGQILCPDDPPEHQNKDGFILVCAGCVQERGWLL